MNNLLTTKEIAKYLRLRPETVLRKVNCGEMPAIRVGGRFRFDKHQIDEWLNNRVTIKKNILVIDDEEIIRTLFKSTLESEGYNVITSNDGNNVSELLQSLKFDLIFIDLKMPGIDGAETFRRIRKIDSSIPVVIITGYPISDLMEQAMEQGPLGVMKKPFNAAGIRKSVNSFLKGIEAKRSLTEGFQQLGYIEKADLRY